MSLNRIIIIGRLVRDPEKRTTNSGTDVAEISVAVDKRIKPKDASQPTADFFRVKVWGQGAEFITNYGSKGRLVSVEGRMEARKFTDRDGNQREVWELVADNVQLLDRPRDDGPGGGAPAPRATGGGSTATVDDEYDPFADE